MVMVQALVWRSLQLLRNFFQQVSVASKTKVHFFVTTPAMFSLLLAMWMLVNFVSNRRLRA
jgi:hypothetical protein